MSDEPEATTLNADHEGLGDSSSPGEIALDSPDVYSTVEDLDRLATTEDKNTSSEETLKTDGETEKPQEGREVKETGAEPESPSEVHKHPAWQRIMGERNSEKEARIRAEGERDAIKQLAGGRTEPTSVVSAQEASGAAVAVDLPYVDITTKSDEELLEWQESDPKGYAANLFSQMVNETRKVLAQDAQALQSQSEAETRKSSALKTVAAFKEKNPDFDPMFKSGQIESFMRENPGHNALSAYYELTASKRTEEAIDKAVKAHEKKLMDQIKAKRNITVLGSGPSSTAHAEEDSTLKNTTKHGGKLTVLADRLRGIRRSVGG